MNYKDIRKIHWATQKKKLKKEFGIDFKTSPYTYFKSSIYIELSAILVFFLQSSFLKPNAITNLYAFFGVIGGLLLSSNNQSLVIYGLLIFFFKGILDWSDGLLARINGNTSELGSILDDWAGYVGQLSFWIGLGFYLYFESNDQIFLFLTLVFTFLKCIDLKLYTHIFIIKKILEKKIKLVSYKNERKKSFKKYFFKTYFILRNIIKNTLDDRARTIDFICLIIFLNTYYFNIFFLKYFFYLVILKTIIVFTGNFYLVFFKNYISQLNIKNE